MAQNESLARVSMCFYGSNVTFDRERAMLATISRILGVSLVLALLQSCGGGGGGDVINPTHPGDNRPTLTSLSPSNVPVGSPAFTLILNGSGFVAGGTVTWAGTNIGTYTFVSSTQVTIPIPASLVATQGKVNIVVTNAAAGSKPSDFISFDVGPLIQSGCVLFGTYDFFFTGFDSTGPMTTAGAFGIDVSGKVSGEVDYKNRTETRLAEPVTGGTCTNGPIPNTGKLTITTASGTSTYTFATQGISPADRGRIAESGDTNGVSGTGRFVFIHPGALAGDYVFAVAGADLSGQRMGIVGRFTDAGTLSNGVADINDNGTVTSSAVLTGSVSAPDAYSRSTATLVIGGQAFKMAFYALRPEAGFAIDIDPVGSGAILSGFVNAQLDAGRYSNANLGSPFVFSTWGIVPGASPQSDTRIGVSSGFNTAGGTLNLQLDALVGGVTFADQVIPAVYSIASSGRGTLSYTLNSKPNNYVLYLYDSNAGFLLQTDTVGSVQFGTFEAQDIVPFNNALINGTFAGGGWFNPLPSSPKVTAQYSFADGNISATTPAGALTGTYSVSASGRATGTVSQPVFGSNNIVFYIISSAAVAVMGTDAVPAQGDTVSYLHQ